MKLLITGAAGQLGTELCRQLRLGGSALGALPAALKGAQATPVDMDDADLADAAQCAELVRRTAPDAVINCAAFTHVDAAETQRDAAFAANAIAPRNLAMACEQAGAKLLHLSTDYVFGGTDMAPFSEADRPAPASVYGATKLLGEEYVRAFCRRWFIVRTSWLYARSGGNFVKTMLRLATEKPELRVVDDQQGNPTNAEDLAHHLLRLVPTAQYGLYHCTGGGVCTWYQFACEILRLYGSPTPVKPCTSAEFASAAKRPANSALEHRMLRHTVGDAMRPWQQAIAAYIEELKSAQ